MPMIESKLIKGNAKNIKKIHTKNSSSVTTLPQIKCLLFIFIYSIDFNIFFSIYKNNYKNLNQLKMYKIVNKL